MKGSPLFSVEWNSVQPVERKKIAHRFIAEVPSLRAKSRKDDRMFWLEREEAERCFFRPDGTSFVVRGGPAMNRWAIFGRPSGTLVGDPVVPGPSRAADNPNPFHCKQPGTL
jgi:hypothetical protein